MHKKETNYPNDLLAYYSARIPKADQELYESMLFLVPMISQKYSDWKAAFKVFIECCSDMLSESRTTFFDKGMSINFNRWVYFMEKHGEYFVVRDFLMGHDPAAIIRICCVLRSYFEGQSEKVIEQDLDWKSSYDVFNDRCTHMLNEVEDTFLNKGLSCKVERSVELIQNNKDFKVIMYNFSNDDSEGILTVGFTFTNEPVIEG